MPVPLAGPGQGLPYPQNLYPSELQNAPQDVATNRIGLSPGDVFVIPAGDYLLSMGFYCVLQFLDPVTNVWTTVQGAAWNRGPEFVSSDGFNQRIANLTGCVVSAAIINGGTSYVQATTTITPIGGWATGIALPTLLPIVGGALGLTGTFTVDVPKNGAGFGVPPLILIPPPPPAQTNSNGVGGIPAVAVCTIASGTISSVSIINPGAGYPTAPAGVVVPSPFDPNLATGITLATVQFSLASAGAITGVLVTNNGGALPNGSLNSVTLTIGGAGSSGSLTANVMQTIVSGTLSSAGTGYGTGGVGFTTYGGAPLAGSITNGPDSLFLSFLPRQANLAVTAASLSLAAPATIYDGGLFESAPTIAPLNPSSGGAAPTTIAGLTAVMGSRYDFVILQPAP